MQNWLGKFFVAQKVGSQELRERTVDESNFNFVVQNMALANTIRYYHKQSLMNAAD